MILDYAAGKALAEHLATGNIAAFNDEANRYRKEHENDPDPYLQFFGVDLRGKNLRGADLRRTHFMISDLQGADLTGADVRDAIFRWDTVLAGANFDSARMRGVILHNAFTRGVNCTNAEGAVQVVSETVPGAECYGDMRDLAKVSHITLIDHGHTDNLENGILVEADYISGTLEQMTERWLNPESIPGRVCTDEQRRYEAEFVAGTVLARALNQAVTLHENDPEQFPAAPVLHAKHGYRLAHYGPATL